MKFHNAIAWVICVLMASSLVACGGSAVNNPTNKPVQNNEITFTDLQPGAASLVTPVTGRAPDYSLIDQVAPVDFTHTVDNRFTSTTGFDMDQLPELPPLAPRTSLSPTRTTSAVQTIDLSNVYDSKSCVYTTESLVLTSGAGGFSWAIYEIPMARYNEPFRVFMNGTASQKGLWLGFSNYNRGIWEFRGEERIFQFGSELENYTGFGYTNGLPATYVLLLTYDTGDVTITNLQLETTEVIPDALPDEWLTALGNVGLGPNTPGSSSIFGDDLVYGSFTWTGYDDLRTMLPIYWSAWYGRPGDSYPEFGNVTAFPEYTRDLGDSIEDATSLQEVFLAASNQFPVDKRTTEQTSDPTLDATNPLATSLATFITTTGSTADVPALTAACAAMPLDQQNALAEVVEATTSAYIMRQTQINEITTTLSLTETDWDNLFEYTHGGPTGLECLIAPTGQYSPIVYNSNNVWLRGWPYPDMLFEGSALIADAIDNLESYIATESPTWENINLSFTSDAGEVTIGGTGNDTHAAPGDGNGHAILIDLGGDDTYNCHAGGTASIENGVALCIDLGGNDTYNRLDDPDDGNRGTDTDDNTSQQGAGRYGIGILADFAGDDHYNSVRMSQGSAVMGVGMLVDYDGTDVYDMEALGQGGAMGGIGLLWDRAGVDSYTGWAKVQGCGLLMGIGWLVDSGIAGDTYYCEPAENANKPEYYSASYSTNMSIAQGCGWGARWSWLPASNTGSTGTVGSGGMGLLFDGGGDDNYTCGTFGMGCGFYQGIGLLLDRGGNDNRNGHWYTNGATAHVAAAIICDTAGNDNYTNNQSIGIGGAHDWSLTWFIDREGNDTYSAGGLGLGCGYSNGFGYFLDLNGDDSYTSSGTDFQDTSLGKGNLGDANRPDQPSYGIFLDLNGTDTYDAAYQTMVNATGLPGNNASWIRTLEQNVGDPPADYTNGKGSGLDTVEE